ncbi:hypothetical protein EXIGLDRAFT_770888 [Exidia glandulosa HHB12029]|uniref:Uncharacterized protein n=1 Tax=Exidia glandulosa HHB12029 TaxID=1314781 RepID=A0A165GEB9_EXIGL|nr:hypothetical protein EXIGLDRAFT_770888 [Exidia glandulosa HHB12029]
MRSPSLVALYQTASGGPEASPAARSPSLIVHVGPSGQFVFVPRTVAAPVGETVTFAFAIASPLHTVTQSVGVEDPCVQRGFSSNLGVVDLIYDVVVNNTEPIHIFSPLHCELGMVMIINPRSPTEIDSFVAAAQGRSLPGPTNESSITTPSSAVESVTAIIIPSPIITSAYTGTVSNTAVGPVSPAIPGSAHRNIILVGVLVASTLLACALAVAFIIRRRIRRRAIALGQPRALRPPSAGVPVRERNPLKEKSQAAEASSDARIHEPGQGETGTDARLRAALEALAALQTEVQQLRQADIAETLPEYVSRDGDGRSCIE